LGKRPDAGDKNHAHPPRGKAERRRRGHAQGTQNPEALTALRANALVGLFVPANNAAPRPSIRVALLIAYLRPSKTDCLLTTRSI